MVPSIIESHVRLASQPSDHDPTNGSKSGVNATVGSSTLGDEKHVVDDFFYPHPTDFKLTETPIDEPRQLKVAIIGAGLTGITAGVLLPAKVPGIQLTIFEKNADVGGTWYENIYPGVRKVDAHVYQSTFSPNTEWSEEYAQGAEIRNYWQSVAQKHDVYSKIRLNTTVRGAYWQDAEAKWRLETMCSTDGREVVENFDFLITAIGHFNDWRLPKYPGIDIFEGVLLHSSGWDPKFDPTGKRIATIGNGASGIQVTTEIRKVAAHVDHYARSKTWIAGSFAPEARERQDTPIPISSESRESFAADPKVYLKYRKGVEDDFWRAFATQFADSVESKNTRSNFINLMKKRLTDDPSLLEKLVPDFPPHCRRLTPGPGYLEALTKPNLEFIQTPIREFTKTGIITVDGVERDVDAVICSTGANTDFAPPFPIVAGDYDLSRDWKPEGAFGFPYTYLGMCCPFFPNLGFLLGPNSAGPSGTVPHTVETSVTYLSKMLRKISKQDIRTMVPSKQAADDFVSYCDAFFPRTNLARNCSSWSNGGIPGARIHGHWPGSASHLNHVRRDPRWEDFEYTYLRPENRFAYFGNGWTKKETQKEADMTTYLRLAEDNDLRDLHERWWDL